MDELRQSGLVLLLLSADYGAKQKTGFSATHEEYRDAKGNRPVIAFVRSDVTHDPGQAAFIKEVQDWEAGLFRGSFDTPQELRTAIIRAIHAWQPSNVTGPLDAKALVTTAVAAVRTEQEKHRHAAPSLVLAVAAAPEQAVLRPSEIEKPSLSHDLLKEALFGHSPIFSHADGNESDVEGNRLVIQQAEGARMAQLDAEGNLLFRLALEKDSGPFAIIKEIMDRQVVNALKYAAAVLERINPTQKLTHVALAASLAGANSIVIRTQAEHNASPNSYQIGGGLNNEAEVLAEDLVTLLRRKQKG